MIQSVYMIFGVASNGCDGVYEYPTENLFALKDDADKYCEDNSNKHVTFKWNAVDVK